MERCNEDSGKSERDGNGDRSRAQRATRRKMDCPPQGEAVKPAEHFSALASNKSGLNPTCNDVSFGFLEFLPRV